MPSRIIALDYGTCRIGIAVTDPLRIIAYPLETVKSKDIFSYLENFLIKNDVECFVVGWPHYSKKIKYCIKPNIILFLKKLKKKFPSVKVHLENEMFTTKIAKKSILMLNQKKSEKQNKLNIDKISATLILQSYLKKNT